MLFNQQPSPESDPEVQEVSIDKKLMGKGLESLYEIKQFIFDEMKSAENGMYTIKGGTIPSISNSRYIQNLKRELREVQAVIDFKQQNRDDTTQKEYLGGDINFPIIEEEDNHVIGSLPKKTLDDLSISELKELLTILEKEGAEIKEGDEELTMNR